MLLRELVENLAANGVTVKEVTGAMDVEIARVVEDSRKVRAGDLFVARGGTKTDGAAFVRQAIARGAVGVVLDGDAWRLEKSEALRRAQKGGLEAETNTWVVVDEVTMALPVLVHAAAGWPARRRELTCIGITGTKGKTTVAYLLRSILRAAGKRVGMIGTVEIDDGKAVVPADMTTPGPGELADLMRRMQDNGVTHCVMEVSSHALHQKRVEGIDFKVGVFTNLTGDHLDYHKTMDEYAAAKGLLFKRLEQPGAVAVINWDDPYAQQMMNGCPAEFSLCHLDDGHAVEDHGGDWEWIATIETMTSSAMTVRVQVKVAEDLVLESATVHTPLVGRHNAYNLLSAMAAARACGVSMDVIVAALGLAAGAPGRLQRVEREAPYNVFVDYAHTHDSLENVLTALRATMRAEAKLICVFGCGGDRDRTKRPKMGAIAERLADVAIVTSDNPRTENPEAIIDEICAGFSRGWRATGNIHVEPDRRAAIQMAIEMAQKGDVVLIAGKGHENYQIIGTTKHHFDDVEEATAAIERTLKRELRTEKVKL